MEYVYGALVLHAAKKPVSGSSRSWLIARSGGGRSLTSKLQLRPRAGDARRGRHESR